MNTNTETIIQLEPGYADKYVTIILPPCQRLTFNGLLDVRAQFAQGLDNGQFKQNGQGIRKNEWITGTWSKGIGGYDSYGWHVQDYEYFDNLKNRGYDKKLYGTTNDAPAGFRAITEAEFTKDARRTSQVIVATNHVQIRRYNDGTPVLDDQNRQLIVFAKLFLMSDGTGYGFETFQRERRVQWYHFELCLHDDEQTAYEMCLTTYKCKKCGRINQVDSSG